VTISVNDQMTRQTQHHREASAAGRVRLAAVVHEYSGVRVLERTDLDIRPGEFFTLLGASGSGKSTLLHIIAGLLEPTRGTVLLDETDVTRTPPQGRDVGMVFQNYALFPHMTAAKNIAFPLEVRKEAKPSVSGRVNELLELVELTGLGRRLPSQLSGGQQQRVAIARALAAEPRVLLLDEPLGALDRQLREQLATELRKVQRATGVTAIYVTHDQDEAFALSDRIAVLEKGRLLQVGTPEEIYRHPANLFVAGFVGDMNAFRGSVASATDTNLTVDLDDTTTRSRVRVDATSGHNWSVGEQVVCLVRPEQLQLESLDERERKPGQVIGRGRIESSTFLGDQRIVRVAWCDRTLLAKRSGADAPPRDGEEVEFGWAPNAAHVILAEV
jgi:spermidine/putrescine ABC transporter ATP-binding subunit